MYSNDNNSPQHSQRLGVLKPGQKGKITNIISPEGCDVADRLRELGFDEELSVQLLHQSPFGKDPISVQVGQMTVALRRKHANQILVALD